MRPIAVYFFLLTAALNAAAPTLVVGQSYELELADGSRLHRAVYRGKEGGHDLFELTSIVGNVKLADFKIIETRRPAGWLIAAGISAALPLNQADLGFSQGLGGQLGGSIPVFSSGAFWLPRLTGAAGFLRYSGSKALLSGPDVMAGPGWLLVLGDAQRHWLQLTALAGAGFYQLLNQNIGQTFAQNTFVATLEAGYLYRFARWGAGLSYVQQYIHDEKLPFTAGGLKFVFVYFGGDA